MRAYKSRRPRLEWGGPGGMRHGKDGQRRLCYAWKKEERKGSRDRLIERGTVNCTLVGRVRGVWLGSPLQECGSRAQRAGGVFGTKGERLKGEGGRSARL